MGTTLVLAVLKGLNLKIASVGDSSACLRVANRQPQTLTTEQTMAAEFLRAGKTPDPYMRHVLTQCLGQPDPVTPEIVTHEFPAGSMLLLCSDGISKPLEMETVLEEMKAGLKPAELVSALMQDVESMNVPDDATVVAVFNGD